jgi:hypothetical protein
MKKIFLSLTALLATVTIIAQTPVLSGTWQMNAGKSKLSAEFSFAPKQIVITQSGNSLKVEKKSAFQDQEFVTTDNLTLDGKECVNTGFMDSQKKSVVTFSADKKVIIVTSKMSIGDGGEMTTIEKYSLDGATLMVETSNKSSFGDTVETAAYDKK